LIDQAAEQYFEQAFPIAVAQYGFGLPEGYKTPTKMWDFIAVQNMGMQTQVLDSLQRITTHGSLRFLTSRPR
jgi:hypothetical protein